ncbi:MAG: UDP-N-acetylmuramate:L-alanyl-gamma-D-glutamyl-meso-diaminopimelate ligase [Betaproteobacteria bacterium]|nr:UDP-N-acetylmuramate:L-alanyl-gamma-D-glutamyl-meso-diaminopimelate ligase [Betaproteobacteria bacterium]
MHLHVIGICGTFMGGLAQLARSCGFRVTGCDANVYPPMSTQLAQAGIEVIQGFEADQLDLAADVWVVGNVARRGMPLIEALLNRNAPMISGPQWLGQVLLPRHRVLAVAGTHGKTTTSALLAWILEAAGHKPSFLIGGVPENFGVSARLSPSLVTPLAASAINGDRIAPFVIEADEYDTAFFDKRSKFLHYRAEVAVLNNLEFDHADIFSDLTAIETQFHHWIRTLPAAGRLIVNGREPALARVIDRGAWTPLEFFHHSEHWSIGPVEGGQDHEVFEVLWRGQPQGQIHSPLLGEHNRGNVLAAVAAARAYGIEASEACAAISAFLGVKRRMQLRGEVRGIQVLDDFAHHPTAIATTLEGLRAQMQRRQSPGRLLAVLEPRSNTMKLGVMSSRLASSLESADVVFGYSGGLDWDLSAALAPLGSKFQTHADLQDLVAAVVQAAKPGDRILVMSNGGFGGIHERLLAALA